MDDFENEIPVWFNLFFGLFSKSKKKKSLSLLAHFDACFIIVAWISNQFVWTVYFDLILVFSRLLEIRAHNESCRALRFIDSGRGICSIDLIGVMFYMHHLIFSVPMP